jgi:hypothetical protein
VEALVFDARFSTPGGPKTPAEEGKIDDSQDRLTVLDERQRDRAQRAAGCVVGRDAIRDWAAGIVDRLSSDYLFYTTAFFEDDEHYASEWTTSGTHDRSGPRLPATGKPFRIQGASIGRRSDGLITMNPDYWNMLALLTQVAKTA